MARCFVIPCVLILLLSAQVIVGQDLGAAFENLQEEFRDLFAEFEKLKEEKACTSPTVNVYVHGPKRGFPDERNSTRIPGSWNTDQPPRPTRFPRTRAPGSERNGIPGRPGRRHHGIPGRGNTIRKRENGNTIDIHLHVHSHVIPPPGAPPLGGCPFPGAPGCETTPPYK